MTDRTEHRMYWTFKIKVSDIIEATKDKVNHHTQKVKHWELMEKKAEEDLRETGVEFRDSVAGNAYQTQQGVQIVIDPQKQKYLSDCQAKFRDHQNKLHSYETYLAALGQVSKDDKLDMTVEDMKFFGL